MTSSSQTLESPAKPGRFRIYIYHVFEHLNPLEAKQYIGELRRILKKDGILRVSIADYEAFARKYLLYLEKAAIHPSESNLTNYEWSLMRMIDQMVRDHPGGQMGKYWRTGRYMPDYIREEFGNSLDSTNDGGSHPGIRIAKILSRGPHHFAYAVLRWARRRWFGGDPRSWGECDRWINDRVFMRELSRQAGFTRFSKVAYHESEIPDWGNYDFDRGTNDDAVEFDPSSYFEYSG